MSGLKFKRKKKEKKKRAVQNICSVNESTDFKCGAVTSVAALLVSFHD